MSFRVSRLAPGALLALIALLLGACVPRPQIVQPQDLSDLGSAELVPVEIRFSQALPSEESLSAVLLTGVDQPPGVLQEIPANAFDVATDLLSATAELDAATYGLTPGRNTLFVRVDADGDGNSENVASSTFSWTPGGLLAGACALPITPIASPPGEETGEENHSFPVFMAGFGTNRTPCLEGEEDPEANCEFGPVHDDLWARGVVLESGDTKIAVVTLDVVGYFHNEVRTIRSMVPPELGFDSITVTSTHNHEGPDTMGIWGPTDGVTGADIGYLDFVNDQVVACIQAANDARVPADIRFATGSTEGASDFPGSEWPDLVADGRVLQAFTIPAEFLSGTSEDLQVQGDPGPIINASVPTFQVRDRSSGDTIVTAVNYASHPEVMADDNRTLTSDFPHYMRERLEDLYGGVAIYISADLGVLQGPLDVDVMDPLTGQLAPSRSFRKSEIMGQALADRAADALDAAAWESAPEIQAWSSGPLDILVENPFFQFLGNVAMVFGRRTGSEDGNGNFFVTSEVQLLRIGPAQMVVTPNELDPQIANDYRAQMAAAEHKWVLGLGNDEVGYQMPEAKFVPGCFECGLFVFTGIEDCPFFRDFYSQLDPPASIGICDTIFQNNIGPSADPLFQDEIGTLIEQANP